MRLSCTHFTAERIGMKGMLDDSQAWIQAVHRSKQLAGFIISDNANKLGVIKGRNQLKVSLRMGLKERISTNVDLFFGTISQSRLPTPFSKGSWGKLPLEILAVPSLLF